MIPFVALPPLEVAVMLQHAAGFAVTVALNVTDAWPAKTVTVLGRFVYALDEVQVIAIGWSESGAPERSMR